MFSSLKLKCYVAAWVGLLLIATAPAQEALHQDLLDAMNSGQGTGPNRLAADLPQTGKITLKSGLYEVALTPVRAFTIEAVSHREAVIINAKGAQGTVVLTEKGKDSQRDPNFEGDPWIGTAHGGEMVHTLTCTVDGVAQTLTPDCVFSGERIVFEKTSTLYKFAHRATLTLTPDGLEEYRELRALEDFGGLHYLYLCMYSWVPTTTSWAAGYQDGSEETGGFEGSRVHLQKDGTQIQWYAQYDADQERGFLQRYLEPSHPVDGFVVVADRYHKAYARLPVRQRTFAQGETIRLTLRVEVLENEVGDWTATRAAVAEQAPAGE